MPEISVVVPLYNKRPYVERAIHSIAAQTLRDIEVLVVDDGSTDGGGDLAAAFPDPRFRVIRQVNRGPGAARNRGIAEARAELLAFLDADDEWLPEYLERAAAALRTTDAAACTCSYFDCPGDASSEPLWHRRGLRDGLFRVDTGTSPELFLHMVAFMSPCTTVARRDVVRRWGGFHEQGSRYGEDASLWLKVLLNEAVAVHLAPRVRLHHDAAALSKNLRGARPLEPFLENPEDAEAACPPELRPLLQRFYTMRAFKTACFWGYWGQAKEARALRRRFRTPLDYQLPFYWASLICGTPLGGLLGALWRKKEGFKST